MKPFILMHNGKKKLLRGMSTNEPVLFDGTNYIDSIGNAIPDTHLEHCKIVPNPVGYTYGDVTLTHGEQYVISNDSLHEGKYEFNCGIFSDGEPFFIDNEGDEVSFAELDFGAVIRPVKSPVSPTPQSILMDLVAQHGIENIQEAFQAVSTHSIGGMVLNPSTYYWIDSVGEVSLGYYYQHPDLGEWGFGLNLADGGGFIPVSDLRSDTVITDAGVSYERPG